MRHWTHWRVCVLGRMLERAVDMTALRAVRGWGWQPRNLAWGWGRVGCDLAPVCVVFLPLGILHHGFVEGQLRTQMVEKNRKVSNGKVSSSLFFSIDYTEGMIP